jgi:hypothetical protein
METNKVLGLVGMLVAIGSAVMLLYTFVWAANNAGLGPEVALPIIVRFLVVGTVLAAGGLILSLVGIIKGSSGFAIAGLIISTIMLVIYIIFWGLYASIFGGGGGGPFL